MNEAEFFLICGAIYMSQAMSKSNQQIMGMVWTFAGAVALIVRLFK